MTRALIVTLIVCAVSVPALSVPWSPEVLCSGPDATVYVAVTGPPRLLVVDPEAGRVLRSLDLPAAVSGMAASGGRRLYLTAGGARGDVLVLDTATGRARRLAAGGHSPTAPVLSPDGGTLYVCRRFENDVVALATADGTTRWRAPVLREPVAAACSPDGVTLVVANLLPVGPADQGIVAAAVSLVDTRDGSRRDLPLPNGSNALQGVCVSPDGHFAYVTHLLGRFQLPTTQVERGWINTNALSVLDLRAGRVVNTVLLDDVDRGAANPWAVACTADGARLVVSLAGTHELCLLDRAQLHDRLSRVAAGERVTLSVNAPEDVPDDLAFLVGAKERVSLGGLGPRGLVLQGARVIAAEYFSDSLAVLDLQAAGPRRARSVPLHGSVPARDPVRQGEQLFHDARLCFQQWQSCASCHPGGARADGLNWDLLNDGLGNPKNTRSLLFAQRTPPAMARGVRENAESAVRAGMRYIQFLQHTEEEAAAIGRYLASLEPVASPYLEDGRPGPAARRGEAVFRAAGCAACHSGPLYTNGALVDVGTGRDAEQGIPFDTPTLCEVWRTAPYLHDGRAGTLREVVTTCNPDDRHGHTRTLSATQIDDLVAYLETR